MRQPKVDPFGGAEGFRREKLYPHGVPYGIGCHFLSGLRGWVSPVSLWENIKTVMGINFDFNFSMNF